ncbi:MAG: polysaccharide biosynthesis protein [Candidatus Howiella sp.]
MDKIERKEKRKKATRICALFLLDILILNAAAAGALFIRFELNPAQIPEVYLQNFLRYMPILSISGILIFGVFGLYTSLWQFAGLREMMRIALTSLCVGGVYILGTHLTNWLQPRSCYIIFTLLLCIAMVAARFCYRGLRYLHKNAPHSGAGNANVKHIMIIGAGAAGALMISEINKNRDFANEQVVCVIDDDHTKVGSSLQGIKVVGTRKNIPAAVKKYHVDVIILAIPSISSIERAKLLTICKSTNCELKILPNMSKIIDGAYNLAALRKVDISDLLFRDPIDADLAKIMATLQNKVVLVTGGGGSIGSELCRQIAQSDPKQLIIFDICENGAYDIQMELEANYPDLDLVTLIGSVRDTKRVDAIFDKYRPEIVYHAAAHKHVPLMEDSPNESVKNNIFGTLKTVQAADKYGAKRFVMISTDKAVNPTNIMGATKRVCEMIVQAYNNRSNTDFVAVRFGNVLGSNGSVIPLFKKQIEKGGPVTVTHPDIIRYFMTIPEAVSLVLQAGAYAKGGEIFVLDMGKPVRIVELAENLIRLSGLVPYEDIDIQFTGLRPGEKLYEELLMDEEGLRETENKLIHIGHPIDFDEAELFRKLTELYEVMMDDAADIRRVIQDIVPTYHPKSDPSAGKISGCAEPGSPAVSPLSASTEETVTALS